MKRSRPAQDVVASPLWRPSRRGRALSLSRFASGERLEIAGAAAALAADALRFARRPIALGKLVAELSRKNHARPRPSVETLIQYGVLRNAVKGRVRVRGEGRIREAVEALGQEAGWKVPPLFASDRVEVRSPASRGEVAVFPVGTWIVALNGGGFPCSQCLALRVAGRSGRAGQSQEPLFHSGSPHPPPRLRALLGEVLLELERGPLAPGEALTVGPDEPVKRSPLLAHPDCLRCGDARPADPAAAARELLRALDRHRRSPPRPGIAHALRDERLGPLEIHEIKGRPGRYPLDSLFVWGSVYLTRSLERRVTCSSTYGGIYTNHPEPRLARQIALSEGVERVAARAARPDRWVAATADARTVSPRAFFSGATRADERRVRAWCHGVDLVTRQPRLVPWESVVVGLPARHYPEACHREPFYSGAASHLTLAEAIVHATLEILERDAFMICWYRQRALPRLDWPKAASAPASRRAEYLRARGIELELFDLSFELPLPMLLLRATARRKRGNWPAGGSLLLPATGFDPHHALEHALALACGQFVSVAVEEDPSKDPLDPAAVAKMARQVHFWPAMCRYLDPRNRRAHEFLGRGERRFGSLPTHQAPTARDQMKLLRAWLAERSMAWLAVRLTGAAAHGAGFEVVKVSIPGLVALAPTRGEVDLGLPRMRRGWPDATCSGLNPDPHPLY